MSMLSVEHRYCQRTDTPNRSLASGTHSTSLIIIIIIIIKIKINTFAYHHDVSGAGAVQCAGVKSSVKKTMTVTL